MKRFKSTNKQFNTMKNKLFIVFFCCLFNAFLLFFVYTKHLQDDVITVLQEKIDKVIYQFFTDLITDDVINLESTQDILEITKNSKEEIISVEYNLEKTYKILTDTSVILKEALSSFENGLINVTLYDEYITSSNHGLIMNIPLFLGSNNVFLTNLGPKIPLKVNFSGNLLTNIKTKVTDYGLNNALLEIYVTVEMDKLLITPVVLDKDKFYYDILIGAVVVHGSVPNFYGGEYLSSSSILDIPLSN